MPKEAGQLDLLLPENLDAERFTLGAILAEGTTAFLAVSAKLTANDFSLEKHKRIFRTMEALYEKGENIDRVTVAEALMSRKQLASVDGLSYLVSLDDGLPHLYNLDSYVRIVREKSVYRMIVTVGQEMVDTCLAQTESPDDIAQRAAMGLLNLTQGKGTDGGLVRMSHYANSDPEAPLRLSEPHRAGAGIPTGFLRFDSMTAGGLRAGELWIVAGRPAMGKTALVLSLASHILLRLPAATGRKLAVAIFSLEMTKDSLMHRLMCAHARVDQSKFRAGYLSPSEREELTKAMFELLESPLYIDDSGDLSIADLYTRLMRMKAELDAAGEELGVVVIDYLQLMRGVGRFENRVQEISSITRRLKIMSKLFGVPFVVLSQLNRAPETRPGDHRPQLSDLRESGSVEQDADGVAFIFREEVYRPDKESLKGIAELIVAKQRNGPTGRVKLAFINRYTRFSNLAADTGEEEEQGPFEDVSLPPFSPPKAVAAAASDLSTPFDEPEDDRRDEPWFS